MQELNNNIGYACTFSQVANGLGEKTAFQWLTSTLESSSCSFAELDLESNRFANVLANLGVVPGACFSPSFPRCAQAAAGYRHPLCQFR